MKIVVGLSGGVDSSTVAALLKSQGHDVIGVTMKTYNPDNPLHDKLMSGTACYGSNKEKDIDDCKAICSKLDIPYYIIDVSNEFEKVVMDNFKSEYLAGRTPNPCVVCNKNIKFGVLINKMIEMGIEFDYFATGHYARLERKDGYSLLKKAKDVKKDQSYFLSHLDPVLLNRVMFPLGDYTKIETRQMAHDFGLINADKHDSQDFVSGGDYSIFFSSTPGDIVNESGKVLGRHTGITNYTIGQRKGINVGSTTPLFVKEIDAINNRIIVTSNEGLFVENISVVDTSFHGFIDDSPFYIKIRQNHEPAQITSFEYNNITKSGKIHTLDKQRGITPGQTAVIYQNDIIIGSGTIGK